MPSDTENLLKADHVEVDDLFELVFAAADDLDAAAVLRHLDLLWARLAMHIRAEQKHVFPVIGEATDASLAELLAMLRRDHDFFMRQVGEAVKATRRMGPEIDAATIEFVRENLLAVRAKLNTHNEVEETDVYPLTQASRLSTQLAAELGRQVDKELSTWPPRFAGASRKE